jgi:molybdate transport system ATP-binding protein
VDAHAPSDPGGIRARLAFARSGFDLEVELDLPARGVTALFGESGAGKTTLLRLLAGLERGRGRVDVLGECWQDDTRRVFVPVHRRGSSCVLQQHPLFAHLSVRGNVEYGRRRAARRRGIDVDALIATLGLEPLLDRPSTSLSGGERQRVAIAQALAAQPNVLLLDEPLAALDARFRRELLVYLEGLKRNLQLPIVYVSHSVDEVARLADHLVLLDRGRVLAAGPLKEMLARLDLTTALGDDAGVVFDARIARHEEGTGLSDLEVEGATFRVARIDRLAGTELRVRVLARDVSLALEAPRLSSILNVLTARVVEIRDAGRHQSYVRLALGGAPTPLLARVTHHSVDALGLRPGLQVVAQVKAVALLV